MTDELYTRPKAKVMDIQSDEVCDQIHSALVELVAIDERWDLGRFAARLEHDEEREKLRLVQYYRNCAGLARTVIMFVEEE